MGNFDNKIFFHKNPQPLFIFQLKSGKILEVNQSALKFYGYTRKEFLQLTIFDLTVEHEQKRLKSLVNSSISNKQTKKGVSLVWIQKTKKGKQLFVELSANYINYNNLNCKLALVTDVTEKILNEEKYKKLSEATSEAVVLHENGIIISANKSFEKLFGYKINEIIGKSVLKFAADKSKEDLINKIKKGYLETYRAYGLHKNGTEFLCELTPKQIDYFGRKIRVTCVRDISRQILIQEKLNESKRFITSIISNLQGTIYRCLNDKNWTMQYISPNVLQLTGYSDKHFIQRKIYYNDLIEISYRENVWNAVQKAIKQKQPYQIVYPIINKSKKVVWVWEQGSAVFDNSNKAIALEGYLVDITNQKNKELELEKNRAAFVDLVEDSPDGIFIHHNGKLEYANKAFIQFLGFKSLNQILGKNVLQFVSPAFRKIIKQRMEEAITGKNMAFLEYDMILPNGIKKRVESKGNAIVFNGKNCIQVVIHDLTSKNELHKQLLKAKIIEETNKVLTYEIQQRKKIEEELSRAQSFSKNLINSSLDVIMAADNKNIITEVNKACFEVFGYEPEELIGKKTPLIFADKKQHSLVNKSLKDKGNFKGEVLNIHKSGRVFVSYLSASVIRDQNGKIIGTMGVSRDITEQKRNELILKQSEQNYRSLFEKAYIGFAKIALDGSLIEANPRFNQMFKIASNISKLNFKDIVAPDEYLYILEIRKKLLKGIVENFADEILCIDTNGSEVFVNMTCSLSRNEKKEPDYFIVLLEDISQKKKNEEKVFLQAAKLNAVFESSSHLIWTVNRNSYLTSFNSNFSQTIHKIFGKIIDPYKTKLTQIFNDDEYEDIWVKNYKEAFEGKIKQFEVKLKDNKGKPIWYEIFLYPIFSLKLEVFEVSALGNEITDRKLAEQKIAETAAKLKSIFEGSSHLIFTINFDLILTSFNENFYQKVKQLTGLNVVSNKTKLTEVIALLGKIYQPWQNAIIQAFNGQSVNFEFEFFDQQKNLHWLDVYIQPIGSGTISEISVIAHDITDKKVAIDKSLLQAARINSIFQNSSLMIYTIDENYLLTSFNENYSNFVEMLTGKKPYEGQDLNKGFLATHYQEEHKRLRDYHYYALKGNSITYESEIITSSGKLHWFENHLDPIVLPDGKIEGVTYITREITEKKEAEKKLIESSREKEVLLKEVHHRVKNNLQVISSILSLQSNYTKDPSVLTIIRESQNRIKSMSFIHETLYQTKNFSNINFSNYLKNIVNNLVQTYQVEENKVSIKFELDDVDLDLDTSIPCGLIFNELISNALKYAFKGKAKGLITVGLKKMDNRITIRVKDNGVGLPKNLDIHHSESLGLQLVTALTEQIGGKLEYFSNKGSEFIITFISKLKSVS